MKTASSTLLLAIAVLMCHSVSAAIYHVKTTGNDSNSGTELTPWRTVQKAANMMLAGDTAIVHPGFYAENISSVRAGSSDKYITFRGIGKPIISTFAARHAYIRFEGFEANSSVPPLTVGTLMVYKGANNCQIVSNIVRETPKIYALWTDWLKPETDQPRGTWIEGNQFVNTGFHMLAINGDKVTVTNNYFHSPNGWDAIRMDADNSVIIGNTFTNLSNLFTNANHTDIIQGFTGTGNTCTNVLFEANFVVNCVNTQIGMLEDQDRLGKIGWWTFRNNIYSSVDGAIHMYIHDVYWHNNTFYRSGRNTLAPIMFRFSNTKGAGQNGKVINNLFIECGSDPANAAGGWYGIDSGITNHIADYNLVAGTQGSPKTGFNEPNGVNGDHIGFSDVGKFDFRLRQGHAGIDSGISLAGFQADFRKQLRPHGGAWDRGAIEFRALNMNPPQNVRVLPP